MKNFMVLTTIVLAACSTATPTKTGTAREAAANRTQSAAPNESATPAQAGTPPEEAPMPDAGIAARTDGLSDLDARTLGCPRAALNAAAREAAKASSLGRYQFSYFRIVGDSHHASYEVHFKSNHYEDPDLKYCVSIYCQQGWDPKTTKTAVSLMADAPEGKAKAASAAHGAHCGSAPEMRVKQRVKR
jgi:hypothetical protein